MHEWIWVWIALAGILLVAEVAQKEWLYLPWALGSGLAAALEYVGAGIEWQWAAFVGLSSGAFVIAQRARITRARGHVREQREHVVAERE